MLGPFIFHFFCFNIEEANDIRIVAFVFDSDAPVGGLQFDEGDLAVVFSEGLEQFGGVDEEDFVRDCLVEYDIVDI